MGNALAEGIRQQEGSEQAALRRAQCGDRTAFDALCAGLDRPMRRFVRRLIGRSPAEDDIVQDAFIALYMNLGRIDPPDNLRPFLYRIVRNRCYDELRHQGRFDTVPIDDGPDRPAPVLPDRRPQPAEAVVRTLAYVELRAAVERLPELQRQALILYVDEGLSYPEIAVAMATDVNNVKARIHHARKNLARRLSPDTLSALGVKER